MALFAIAFPVPPGKSAEWQKFAAELTGPRRAEFAASRKKVGVHERTFLQKTPMGDLIIVTLEGADPASAMQRMSAETDPFTQWFLEQVSSIHGVDMKGPPPGPPPELVIDSEG